MKMRNAAAITLSLLLALSCAARDTPIYNGKLTSDLDANQHAITNLPDGFFPEEEDPHVADWARKGQQPPMTEEKDPIFGEFQSNGGNVTNGVTVVEKFTAEARSHVAPAGLTISEKGVQGEWSWKGNASGGYWAHIPFFFNWSEILHEEFDPTVPDWAKSAQNPSYTKLETYSKGEIDTLVADAGKVKKVADVDPDESGNVPLTASLIGAASQSDVNSLSNIVTQWTTYWDGDDVRVTITNYYGSTALPSMYLEQRMPADETHDAAWFKVVWNELTRWNDFLGGYVAVTNELAQKADRAWGFYDSSTGEYSPDGFLQVSTPSIIIANGMAYQKTITTGGCSMWVLKSTQPTTITGETEQGFFRITDGDGNALFEIVKGDKRVVGATATSLTMDGGSMVITYPVTGEQPTLSVCTDLKAADWQTGDDITVATVAWSGSSGNWVATVTPVGPRPSLFCKADYEVGGNTYIKNNVATSIDKVVVGGHEYTVTVETINGKKLLVLQ